MKNEGWRMKNVEENKSPKSAAQPVCVNGQSSIVNCQSASAAPAVRVNCQLSIVSPQSPIERRPDGGGNGTPTERAPVSYGRDRCHPPFQLSIVNCQLSIVNCQSPIRNPKSAICRWVGCPCQSSIVNCQLSIGSPQSPIVNRPLRKAARHFEHCLYLLDKARVASMVRPETGKLEQTAAKPLCDCRRRMDLPQ